MVIRYTFKLFLVLSFIGFQQIVSSAQSKTTFFGTITDGETGETLIGAKVEIIDANKATVTNEYGFYSITIPATDTIILSASYIGMETFYQRLPGMNDTKWNIELMPGTTTLDEVIIVADQLRDKMSSTQMSMEQISAKTSKVLPALFGEVDIIKTLQLKAGVSSGSEGSTGLYVRGGAGDQNLIMLDEATVYNANHLFGFFSTFNSDAIKDVRLFKGGFPAQYGGRLSSVIDVRMKDGNNKKLSGSGGIGLITSRLTLEGPIGENTSFVVSGRRTYVDLITNAINKSQEDKPDFNKIPGYNFYDLNAKINTKLGEKDRIYLSGYFGKDQFALKDSTLDLGFSWGNATLTARWNHIFNNKLFANTSFIFSDYNYDISNEISGFSFSLGSKIRNYAGKMDFSYNPNSKHSIKMGISTTYYDFTVGRLKAGSDDGSISFSSGIDRTGMEYGLYISDEFEIIKNLKANAGLRLSGWTSNNYFDGGIEPRLALLYEVNPRWSIKGGYARMKQYVHLISNSGISLPTDVWYPSTDAVHPQRSDQVSAGFSYLIAKGLLLTNEYYYKWLKNQVDFRDGANLFLNEEIEREFEFGKGYAYGTEVSLEKDFGKLSGWIAYTLAFVKRGGFPGIMDGRYFSPRYDRRNDIKVVATYKFNRRWTASATWVYGSGDLAWLPGGRALFQDIKGGSIDPVTPIYGDRNTFRLPAYHRGDISVIYYMFPKWGESNLSLSIYNVYDRRNPYFLTLETEFKTVKQGEVEVKIPEKINARQVSLFPILPSITWNFNF
ncbi:TonB-dependent receptor [Candidatus Brachybacter algidus]|uniref:TonB-dependent receptor n=1 Tax=Candidatus Brachybacter algidus TaxID=2982024 RepID=UPI001D6A9F5A|nr:TonB-dependent receptor [Candidatus Brachybacter algidus]MBK6450697.1 TonB-dependent receptor [Candidatus Brachybacter algidus]MBK8842697.1 TonB-dependent receptor [Candidatus Brachybacter algidus]